MIYFEENIDLPGDSGRDQEALYEKYNCDSDPGRSWRYIAEAERILTNSNTVHAKELRAV